MSQMIQGDSYSPLLKAFHDLEIRAWQRAHDRMKLEVLNHIKDKTWMRSGVLERLALDLEVEVGTWHADV